MSIAGGHVHDLKCVVGTVWYGLVRFVVVDEVAIQSNTSAVGLVVKYLVANEMPRVRFPDGA